MAGILTGHGSEFEAPITNDGLGSPQSVYEVFSVAATNQTRATGHHRIGTRGMMPDGRVYYYASSGTTAPLAGQLVFQIGHQRSTDHDTIVATATGAIAIGSRVIDFSETDLDTSDIIENEYADGFLHVQDVTGQGTFLPILGHERIDASGSADRRIALGGPIVVATSATSELGFCRNSYDRIILTSTNEEEFVVGVSPVGVTASTALATDVTTTEAATTTYFFWCQTWGPASVLIGDTTAENGPVMSGTAAGEVLAWNAGAQASATAVTIPITRMQVGIVMGIARADTENQIVDLRIRS